MKSFADSAPRILVADDQADVLEAMRLLLKGEGYQIESVTSPAAAISTLEARDFDVVLIDLNYTRDTTSGQEGLDLLSRIHTIDSILPVIVMTAWGTVGLAVEAMRRGARDFIQKPWENERLLSIVKTQIDLSNAIRRGMRLEAENRLLRAEGVPSLIAESPSMQPVLQMISRVGPTDAKADRVGRFELADGGTLFLDEIANVPMNLQAKMLRVLEVGEMERVGSSKTKRVDVRVISATNAILTDEVNGGRFRQDLLFRLNTIEIHLTPLRERREDIPLLAAHFLSTHAQRYRKRISGFDHASMQLLLDNPWQGNVRELNHVIERAVLMAQESQIKPADLALRSAREGSPRLEDMSIEDVEAFLIKKALARYSGNVSHAANALGLSRSALYRRLQRYGL